MNATRFQQITGGYSRLKVAVLGDFCLDRYLEIDPERQEVSIETGLPVYNVVRVRAQGGGAGTILNNLSALGVGALYPIGFAGTDGEGFELLQALASLPTVKPDGIVQTKLRRTFTYCKPLVVNRGQPPVELNRLDSKNWTPTPEEVESQLIMRLRDITPSLDAVIVLDQVDVEETGVVTRAVLKAVAEVAERQPALFILADSRRGLCHFPPLVYKMNRDELFRLTGGAETSAIVEIQETALRLSRSIRRSVFVTLAEKGIVGAVPSGAAEHLPCLPIRGSIDVVGAGDAVSANLTAATAAGGSLREALELANAAASIVVHKLGTTGTASVRELRALLGFSEG